MEPIKIEQEEVIKAIQSGNPYIQVGNRKFLLFEIEEVNNAQFYEVVDSEEEDLLIAALNDPNPILTEEEIRKMLED